MHDTITEHLAKALREALTGAGLPIPDEVAWEVPRDDAHGDYAFPDLAPDLAAVECDSARRPGHLRWWHNTRRFQYGRRNR